MAESASVPEGPPDPTDGSPPPEAAVRQVLEELRTAEFPDAALAALATYDHGDLAAVRTDRDVALAFWINLYNAAAQCLLTLFPNRFGGRFGRFQFFRTEAIDLDGVALTLDDIRHEIIRNNRSKYGLGYLPRLRSSGLDRAYRLEPDPRIHFALNCGSASCPPIRSYRAEDVDERLDRATTAYLRNEVAYDSYDRIAYVPRVMLWYRGDFGGGSGIREMLHEHRAIPRDVDPRIRYREWDWSPRPLHFVG